MDNLLFILYVITTLMVVGVLPLLEALGGASSGRGRPASPTAPSPRAGSSTPRAWPPSAGTRSCGRGTPTTSRGPLRRKGG